MTQVKGISILTIPQFVKEKFPSDYNDWLHSLSATAERIMGNNIIKNAWYPVNEGLIEPTLSIVHNFYGSSATGAWEGGRYSAEVGLKGLLKIFVRMGSPQFIISNSSKIFSGYYQPANMTLAYKSETKYIAHVKHFNDIHRVIELRIGGWIEKALELNGCNNPSVKITKSIARGDNITAFTISI